MHGWGYCQRLHSSIQADNGQGLTCGIIGLVNKGHLENSMTGRALRVGWGMSKVLDYL
jgi:hypothetical protein